MDKIFGSTSRVDNRKVFWCCSDMAKYEYLVELERSEDLERAMETADEELYKYGNPEESDDYDYYYYVGYVEVVQNAFEKVGIKASFYDKCC